MDTINLKAISEDYDKYLQRPEAIESMFYMWRLTHDQKYRDWAWEIAQSIERYTKISTGGYTALESSRLWSWSDRILMRRGRNVDLVKPMLISGKQVLAYDLQDSYFLAETLKVNLK